MTLSCATVTSAISITLMICAFLGLVRVEYSAKISLLVTELVLKRYLGVNMAPIKCIGFDKAHFTLHSIVEATLTEDACFP